MPPARFPRSLLRTVLAALTLALAACGGDGDEPAAGGGTSPAAATGFPVAVEHRFGTAGIPEAPERVVTVGYNDQDFALALGVTPVGVAEWFGEQSSATWSWARNELGTYSGMTEPEYKRLSRIATTVAQTDGHVDFGMRWQEQTVLIGRALGRERCAVEIVKEIEARFAQVREEHPEFRDATALFAYREERGSFGAYASDDARGRFLRSLGFRAPEDIDELAGDQFFAQLSGDRCACSTGTSWS